MEMSAYNYLKVRNRMCTKCVGCIDCPLNSCNNDRHVSCTTLESTYTSEAIEKVKQWAVDNPQKTNLKKLEEVFGVDDIFRLYTNGNSLFVDWCNEYYKGGK